MSAASLLRRRRAVCSFGSDCRTGAGRRAGSWSSASCARALSASSGSTSA